MSIKNDSSTSEVLNLGISNNNSQINSEICIFVTKGPYNISLFLYHFFYIYKFIKEEARLDGHCAQSWWKKNSLNKRHKSQRTCCNYDKFNEDTIIVYRR